MENKKDYNPTLILFKKERNLPENLQGKLPPRYPYIWFKASDLLHFGFAKYRKRDFFKFPLVEWNEDELTKSLKELVDNLKGIAPEHCIQAHNIETAQHLLLTFHFELIAKRIITNEEGELIHLIIFQHRVDGSQIPLYFKLRYMELTENNT